MGDHERVKSRELLQRKDSLKKWYTCKKCIYHYRCWQNDRGVICKDFYGQNGERLEI